MALAQTITNAFDVERLHFKSLTCIIFLNLFTRRSRWFSGYVDTQRLRIRRTYTFIISHKRISMFVRMRSRFSFRGGDNFSGTFLAPLCTRERKHFSFTALSAKLWKRPGLAEDRLRVPLYSAINKRIVRNVGAFPDTCALKRTESWSAGGEGEREESVSTEERL